MHACNIRSMRVLTLICEPDAQDQRFKGNDKSNKETRMHHPCDRNAMGQCIRMPARLVVASEASTRQSYHCEVLLDCATCQRQSAMKTQAATFVVILIQITRSRAKRHGVQLETMANRLNSMNHNKNFLPLHKS